MSGSISKTKSRGVVTGLASSNLKASHCACDSARGCGGGGSSHVGSSLPPIVQGQAGGAKESRNVVVGSNDESDIEKGSFETFKELVIRKESMLGTRPSR